MNKQSSFPGFDVEAMEIQDETHALARAIFEKSLSESEWIGKYVSLMEEGWEWRKAAYIAWASLPAKQRLPSTLKEFASQIGLKSTASIAAWRNKNKAIDLRVAEFARQLVQEHVPEVVQALTESASDSNYKNAPDRRVFLEMAGLYTPRSKIALGHDAGEGDEADLSTDELRRLASMAEKGKGE